MTTIVTVCAWYDPYFLAVLEALWAPHAWHPSQKFMAIGSGNHPDFLLSQTAEAPDASHRGKI